LYNSTSLNFKTARMSNAVENFGWSSVPRSHEALLKDLSSKKPEPLKVEDISLPSTPLIEKVHAYAKSHLAPETYNHSMRVFYYGQALTRQHFPQFAKFAQTYLLTALLHDIGTTHDNLRATNMSFEFYGGFLALDLLGKEGAPQEQAESVCEAIIRHQDLGETGNISAVGQLIQLATVFDNIGMNPHLIHEDTIKSVTAAFPRNKWSGCFASTIREEIGLKPWCHTTVIEGFDEKVEGNKLMEPYE